MGWDKIKIALHELEYLLVIGDRGTDIKPGVTVKEIREKAEAIVRACDEEKQKLEGVKGVA